jgi:hypothetical protein
MAAALLRNKERSAQIKNNQPENWKLLKTLGHQFLDLY